MNKLLLAFLMLSSIFVVAQSEVTINLKAQKDKLFVTKEIRKFEIFGTIRKKPMTCDKKMQKMNLCTKSEPVMVWRGADASKAVHT